MRAHFVFCVVMVIFHQFLCNYCKSRIPPFKLHFVDDNRIIGGECAESGQFPYQLSLRLYGQHICGANLIDTTSLTGSNSAVALTAAHCVDEFPVKDLTIMGGSHLLKEPKQIVDVRKAVVHENYTRLYVRNDIAILMLSTPLSISNTLKPVVLPRQNEEYYGNLTVSGWGVTEDGGGVVNHLRFVIVPTVNNTQCASVYGEEAITPSNICAGYEEGGKDSCQGDSGGPAVATAPGTPEETVLHGLVSWGRGCAEAGYPGVYTRVSSYINWIKDNIQDN